MAENTLGQRMRAAAERAGLTQAEVGKQVAEKMGRRRHYTEAAVGQWYAGKHKVSVPALVEFSRLVNEDLRWLQTGVRGLGKLPREGRIVPTITMQQALQVPIDYTSNTMVHTYFPCSDKAFIVAITDSRNEPNYRVGYKVVIDPQRKPQPDQMVLACIKGEAVFGVYAERDDKQVVILALNGKWSVEIMNHKKGDRIIGTMTEFAGQAA